jgi:hypothetical protein
MKLLTPNRGGKWVARQRGAFANGLALSKISKIPERGTFAHFLRQCCTFDARAATRLSELSQAYVEFAHECGKAHLILEKNSYVRLFAIGFVRRLEDGEAVVLGIRLRQSAEASGAHSSPRFERVEGLLVPPPRGATWANVARTGGKPEVIGSFSAG